MLNRVLQFVFIVLLFFVSTQANTPDDELIWSGINAWYNYETAESVSILDSARKLYPEHYAVHLVYAAARYQHSQAVDPVAENYRILSEDLDEIIPVYEALVAKYPDRPIYRLYYGSAIGLKARIHLGRKQWIRTLWHAYQGFFIIRQVAAENPDLIDAQLPIGIVEYYAALSGGLMKFGAGLLGLEPSLKTGREAIIRAADQGDFAWMEAKGILIYLDLYIDNKPADAIRHARDLVGRFPENWYYRQLLTHCQLATGDLESARQSLTWLDKDFPTLSNMHKTAFLGYLHNEWAYYYFLNSDYENAKRSANRAINDYGAELDAVLGQAYLLKGQLLDLEGNRTAAISVYRKAIKLNNFTYSIAEAEKYLRIPYQLVID